MKKIHYWEQGIHYLLQKHRNLFFMKLAVLMICSLSLTAKTSGSVLSPDNNSVDQARNTLSGIVTDAKTGETLPGVRIIIKGTTRGTVTDPQGKFVLQNSKPNAILVVSYMGYEKQEIAINNNNQLDIKLVPTVQKLDEIVVVGYGTQKRRDITGSVISVDQSRLANMPNTNFAQALEGAMAGVSVSTNSGGAEGSNSIIIRGQKSILANTDPLIILDGIPYNGSISDISPTDIASTEILKDASAAAIYGSRGSNGVILITTKKGSSGKPIVSYDAYVGMEKIANLPPILSPEEFYQFKITREGQSAITTSEQAVYDSKKFPNWLDLATQTGLKTQHTLSVRGGNDAIKYFASANYLDVKGIAVNDNFKSMSTRINLEAKMTEWLTYGTNTQLTYDDRGGVAASFSGENGAYEFNPLTTAFDSLGNQTIYPWPQDVHFGNPLAPILAKNTDNTYKIFTTNYLQVKVPFIKGLGYRLNTGVEYQQRNISTYYGRNTLEGLSNNGSLSTSNSNVNNYTIENILTYDREFGKHTIGITGLYSYEQNLTTSNSLAAQQFPGDVLTAYQANVALAVQPSASYSKRTLISQMARINYGYDGRYLLTLTGRRDGSSAFGVNDKFSFFPSMAFAWNITNESFMKNNKTISNLKLRVSYGSNGNQAIGNYKTLATLATRPYVDGTTTEPGYIPSSLDDPNLHWETTNSANLGLDFGFLKGRIQGAVDLYDAKTHDLLLNRSISPVQGINSITQNIGKTENKGIELTVNSVNVKTATFTWSTNFNISANQNKIVALYGDAKNDTLNRWFIGHPINVNFGYVFNGIYQKTDDTINTPQGKVHPGDAKILDINKDGVINSKDRTIISNNVDPKYTWGMANTFNYKGFSLYIFIQGQAGSKQVNSMLNENGVQSGVRHNTIIKNWWTPTNPTKDYWANSLTSNKLGVPIVQSTGFTRVKDISLGYDFSDKVLQRLKLTKLKIYIEARNLFTYTEWIGLDPEFSSQTTIPLQKEYVVGLNVSL
ncbi:MAG: TonB-dependent receptor [Bacteroidota bacterium]|nr:TonB-dependent receptor [Bacteroidota bacterium]